MIDLYFWTTPNGYKPLLLLEELDLEYQLKTIHIGRGEQFEPDFLNIAPNNRIPAMVDHKPNEGAEPISIFESGAILLYLADKYQTFMPNDLRGRNNVLQWLFWQMGGLGPMLGQNHHFNVYAPEKIDYAIKRYVGESERLYGVLNKQLAGKDFLCGEYSIADMAAWPWIRSWERQSINLDEFPNVKAWFNRINERPATIRAYEKGEASTKHYPELKDDQEAKKILFGQDKNTVK